MEKLIILDFATGKVHIYPIAENADTENLQSEMFRLLGCKESDCLWMISKDEIIFHKEVLK